jgi:FKBP-type peptidyl-prolyl cis-trans isomerase (trigger factor)
VFDLGLKPVFDLRYNQENPIEIVVPAIDQSALDEDIIRYRRVFGQDVPVSEGSVGPHDKVSISLNKINEDGSIDPEGQETVVDLDRIKGEANPSLLDQTSGYTADVDLEKFLGYERSVIIKNTLHLEEDPSPESALQYRITITSIHRPQTEELTGEQLTKFTGKQMQDEAEFRQFLEKREEDNNLTRTIDMKKMAVRLALLTANPFDIPEAFLLKWVNQQRDKKIDDGTREAETLFRDAKWSLLLNRIATEKGLEVTEKDVQRQVTNWIVQNVNYMQTDIRKLMDQLYANEYFMSSMKENALEDVVFNAIMPDYSFVEKPVSVEEFEKAFHDLHHQLFDHGDHDHHDHGHDHHEHSHDHHEHSHG